MINELTSECSSILTEAAKEIGCIKEIKIGPPNPKINSKTKPVKQPWFDNECAKLRRQYKRAKNLRHRINSAENVRYLHNASKAYKKCINKQLRLYKKEFINKLRALQHSDPKSYWNLLNKADRTKKETLQNISLATFISGPSFY